LATGKFSHGINVFLLASQGFQSPYFLTFIQARELGGHVRQGEKGSPIVKVGTWNKPAPEAANSPDNEPGTAPVRRFPGSTPSSTPARSRVGPGRCGRTNGSWSGPRPRRSGRRITCGANRSSARRWHWPSSRWHPSWSWGACILRLPGQPRERPSCAWADMSMFGRPNKAVPSSRSLRRQSSSRVEATLANLSGQPGPA
jgi:hypothetical protein